MSERPNQAERDLRQECARGLLHILRQSVELANRLASQVLSEPERATPVERIDADTRIGIMAAVPTTTAPPVPRNGAGAEASSAFDDPQFEAALLRLADAPA